MDIALWAPSGILLIWIQRPQRPPAVENPLPARNDPVVARRRNNIYMEYSDGVETQYIVEKQSRQRQAHPQPTSTNLRVMNG